MQKRRKNWPWALVPAMVVMGLVLGMGWSSQAAKEKAKEVPSSYAPVDIKEPFGDTMTRMKAEKPKIMERQMELLKKRYDLSDHPAQGVTMTRGKPVQEGVRAKLPAGLTWEKLAAMSPEEIKDKGLWPGGFPAAAPPEPHRGRHGLPQIHDRGDQEAGRPGPDPLRPGLSTCRTTSCRNFRRPSFSPPGPTWGTSPRASW